MTRGEPDALRRDLPPGRGPQPSAGAWPVNETRDPASFRDPAGFVFHRDGRVFRAITEYGLPHVRAVRATGLIERLVAAGQLLPETRVGDSLDGEPDVRLVLEHPRLPFVSYPYEWPFGALRDAALLHLDVQLQALDAGVMLTDASAYNVQFIGARPVFIDHAAFRPYREGELWAAHRQFCEQFLHPLLLESAVGIDFQPWYRGQLDGIPAESLRRVLPVRQKLRWNTALHVVLPARLQRLASRPQVEAKVRGGRLSRAALGELLSTLRRWIARLRPRGVQTPWAEYDAATPAAEAAAIGAFVAEFVREIRPSVVWDLGCNAGRYGEAALAAGADYVVGFDSDAGALEQAYARAKERNLRLSPLYMDVVNPTPRQGWQARERADLLSRGPAGGVLALALVHHIAITRNVPLDEIVSLLLAIAPAGVVAFVPPTDGRAHALFRGREELFTRYTLARFLAALGARARILRQERLAESDRVLLSFSSA